MADDIAFRLPTKRVQADELIQLADALCTVANLLRAHATGDDGDAARETPD
ncbi:hypothetical protein [Kibdelosporangium philippinense]|uniref:hypothetical protein n=1 Tax=Kibdelosporangium philippinense TaxID=211113 RepID=UPI0036151C19